MPDVGYKRIDIFGLPLDVVGIDEVVRICRNAWGKPGRMRIITLNPLMVEAALADTNIAELIQCADLVVADGVGIVWAARKLHGVDVPLIPGIELARALIEACAENRRPVFLLGGREGVAAEAAEELAAERGNLRIIGTHHGYFGPDEDERIVDLVNSSGAHLVLCGMGFPRQDEIVEKILAAGKPPRCYDESGGVICEPSEAGTDAASVTGTGTGPTTSPGINAPPIPPMVGVGVGGSLDVFAGRVRRPSEIWQKLHLEWLARIASEPGKRLRHIPILLRFWWRVVSAGKQ